MKLIVDKGSNGLTTKEFTEYLKTPVLKSEITQQESDELRTQLTEALVKHPGLGISATQIGIKKRACLIKFGDEELFLINPIIKEKSKEGFLFFEGCLSIPSTLTKPIKTIRAMKAVITTDQKIFQLYLLQENLTFMDARQICRKSDLDGTIYDDVIDLDPKQNVTDWVRVRIKSKTLENN